MTIKMAEEIEIGPSGPNPVKKIMRHDEEEEFYVYLPVEAISVRVPQASPLTMRS